MQMIRYKGELYRRVDAASEAYLEKAKEIITRKVDEWAASNKYIVAGASVELTGPHELHSGGSSYGEYYNIRVNLHTTEKLDRKTEQGVNRLLPRLERSLDSTKTLLKNYGIKLRINMHMREGRSRDTNEVLIFVGELSIYNESSTLHNEGQIEGQFNVRELLEKVQAFNKSLEFAATRQRRDRLAATIPGIWRDIDETLRSCKQLEAKLAPYGKLWDERLERTRKL